MANYLQEDCTINCKRTKVAASGTREDKKRIVDPRCSASAR